MSDTIWSPHDIKVLLHHYCIVEPWPLGETPAYIGSKRKLADAGLMDHGKTIGGVTDKGAALIRLWCEQPVPVAQFVDPRF